MKQYLPYNILLVIAAVVTALSVYYNMSLRQNFAVTISYTLPPPPAQSSEEARPQPTQQAENNNNGIGADEEAEVLAQTETDAPALRQDTIVVLAKFPLEINAATMAELQHVPKIGPATAQRIVQYRDELGGYTALIQLKNIKGIGDKTFETMAPYLYVEGEGGYDAADAAELESASD